jgi:hypothetical protein
MDWRCAEVRVRSCICLRWNATYLAIWICCCSHCSAPILRTAASRSASVCKSLTLVIAVVLADPFPDDFVPKASVRCVFFALTGAFPETYLAAPPLPGFAAGSLFAITVVERGIIVVSSS